MLKEFLEFAQRCGAWAPHPSSRRALDGACPGSFSTARTARKLPLSASRSVTAYQDARHLHDGLERSEGRLAGPSHLPRSSLFAF